MKNLNTIIFSVCMFPEVALVELQSVKRSFMVFKIVSKAKHLIKMIYA